MSIVVLPTGRFSRDTIFATKLFLPKMHRSARSVYLRVFSL